MEDLKTMLDNQSITDINQTINKFVHSGDGYENKLKLTFVILNLINESCALLQTINVNGFINDIRQRIEDVGSQSNNLKEAYRRHLDSNEAINAVLANPDDNRMSTLQKDIERLLGEYDSLLESILRRREELPIQTQLNEQQQ